MQAALDQDFLFLLYDVARTMRTRADQRARARGMTRAQWVILAHLERQPGLTQNELAAIVEVEPITIARLVDRLEAREGGGPNAAPRARRGGRLHLTPAAAPILREIGKYRAELHELITAGMTPSLQKALTDGLLQMKVNLAAEAPAAGKAGGAAAPTSSHD